MKKIDEFIKLSVDKMSQEIEDMTYAYENTVVPKSHYKKILATELIELIAQDSTFDLAMLNAVLGQINTIKKEQPRLFFLAMLLSDLGLKVDNINSRIYDSLNLTYSLHVKDKSILSEQILSDYKQAYDNHAETEKNDFYGELN